MWWGCVERAVGLVDVSEGVQGSRSSGCAANESLGSGEVQAADGRIERAIGLVNASRGVQATGGRVEQAVGPVDVSEGVQATGSSGGVQKRRRRGERVVGLVNASRGVRRGGDVPSEPTRSLMGQSGPRGGQLRRTSRWTRQQLRGMVQGVECDSDIFRMPPLPTPHVMSSKGHSPKGNKQGY
ncbi:hypothetical protein L210DRAFT_3509225 [Boletus edulis BED1]|uniref:Uncharacterized protein n=1 Tax=Boletus edulis BED1 TaxID=1328754 RepID=A0AAD4G7Z9_BOLED|nr:hypothetical protein L210DRAFT_3509225 [Boletus edulis BED1]